MTPLTVTPRLQWQFWPCPNWPFIYKIMWLQWHLLTVTLLSCPEGVTKSGEDCTLMYGCLLPTSNRGNGADAQVRQHGWWVWNTDAERDRQISGGKTFDFWLTPLISSKKPLKEGMLRKRNGPCAHKTPHYVSVDVCKKDLSQSHPRIIQRLAKNMVHGCEKFVPDLAYLFCLALHGSFLARFSYFLADPCTTF